MTPNEVRSAIGAFIEERFNTKLQAHPGVRLPTVMFMVEGSGPYLITVTGGGEHAAWAGAEQRKEPVSTDTFKDEAGNVARWPVQDEGGK